MFGNETGTVQSHRSKPSESCNGDGHDPNRRPHPRAHGALFSMPPEERVLAATGSVSVIPGTVQQMDLTQRADTTRLARDRN